MNNNDTKAIWEKVAIYATVFIVSSMIAVSFIKPTWFGLACLGVLLAIGILAFLASPSGSGHVTDNAVTYVITAILLLAVAVPFGYRLTRTKDKHAEQSAAPLPPAPQPGPSEGAR